MLPLPASDTCVLFLVRHGATAANLSQPPMLQGRGIDLPLADRGQEQARQTARFLAAYPLDAVYSSPLVRARETAVEIARHHNVDVATIDELTEVDAGEWEGSHWEQIAVDHPAAFQQFLADPGTHGYPGGENLLQVHARVQPALMRLLAASVGRRIVVVAHNVVNRSFLASVLGVPLAEVTRLKQDNCAINVLSYRAGKTVLHTLNSVFHLS